MGMFDTVVFEADLREGMQPSDGEFQTKSLFRLLETFTVTTDGRLIQHARRYVKDSRYPGGFNEQAPLVTIDIDMEVSRRYRCDGFSRRHSCRLCPPLYAWPAGMGAPHRVALRRAAEYRNRKEPGHVTGYFTVHYPIHE